MQRADWCARKPSRDQTPYDRFLTEPSSTVMERMLATLAERVFLGLAQSRRTVMRHKKSQAFFRLAKMCNHLFTGVD